MAESRIAQRLGDSRRRSHPPGAQRADACPRRGLSRKSRAGRAKPRRHIAGGSDMTTARTPWWAWAWPVLAWAVLLATALFGADGIMAAAAGVTLIATVFAAVYHAEVVAHRTGEPFGTLILAVAVTVIEVALIVSVMLAAPAEKAGLARDTVFAAVMIVCNGI